MSEKRFELLLPNAIMNDTVKRKSYYLDEKEDVELIVDLLNNQAETINKQLKRIQELSDDRKVMEKHELRRLIEISNSQTLRIYAQDKEIQKLLTQIEELKQSKNKEV